MQLANYGTVENYCKEKEKGILVLMPHGLREFVVMLYAGRRRTRGGGTMRLIAPALRTINQPPKTETETESEHMAVSSYGR
jgi:hypothetical protein